MVSFEQYILILGRGAALIGGIAVLLLLCLLTFCIFIELKEKWAYHRPFVNILGYYTWRWTRRGVGKRRTRKGMYEALARYYLENQHNQ